MSTQNKSVELLSEVVSYLKYARTNDEGHRESYSQIVDRLYTMHKDKISNDKRISKETKAELLFKLDVAIQLVRDKYILPSMRSMQFAGKPVLKDNSYMYNCSFVNISSILNVRDVMYLLMRGVGVGYSVEFSVIKKIPAVGMDILSRPAVPHVVDDSVEGWADAVYAILDWGVGEGDRPIFDYSNIRPKGSKLNTTGGTAPGHELFKEGLDYIEQIILKVHNTYPPSRKLKPIDWHDIICKLADAVVSGGVRRSALIALFSANDKEMMDSKYIVWDENGNIVDGFFATHPHRGRANNSVVLTRNPKTNEKNKKIIEKVVRKAIEGKAGEPGIFLRDKKGTGTNPCAEIGLNSNQFCNLTEINGAKLNPLNAETVIRAATFLGTLQASYTHFPYIQKKWYRQTKKEALIGVGITGIVQMDSTLTRPENLSMLSEIVEDENKIVANMLNINEAARKTCVKPAGTTSLLMGTTSGIHAAWSEYYIRRVEINKTDPAYIALDPILRPLGFIEDKIGYEDVTAKICFPIHMENALTRSDETAITQLDRILKFSRNWIHGTKTSDQMTNKAFINTVSHNVSCTVSVKDSELDAVVGWMKTNLYAYSGIALLPFDDAAYTQAPHETISKEKYEELVSKFPEINLNSLLTSDDNLRSILEINDDDRLSVAAPACAGGVCELI